MSQATSKKQKNVIVAAIVIVVLAIVLYFVGSHKTERESLEEHFDAIAYIKEMNKSRELKDIEFADSTRSRFNTEERSTFHGLNYFVPDPGYRVQVNFRVDTSTPVFPMPTNTDRKPNYRIFGYLNFEIHDTACRLTAFQNMEFKDNSEYGSNLFVPFSDKTNGNESYGAGRYLDILIPTQEDFVLDFNEAYNPYCAYADRWSCPLVPFENYLEVAIRAGEKKYKH